MLSKTITQTNRKTKLIQIKQPHKLPQSWQKAAGLMHTKRKALEEHLKKTRLEWDQN
jgi:hypothetical protein